MCFWAEKHAPYTRSNKAKYRVPKFLLLIYITKSRPKKSPKTYNCLLIFFLLFSLESLLETEVGQYLRGPCFRFNECDVGLWSPFMWFSSFAILTSTVSLWPFYSTNFTWFRKTFIYWSFKLCCYFQAVLLWWFNNFTWVSTRN